MYADIFGCYNSGADAFGTYRVEDRDAAKHPTVHRTAPQQRMIQPFWVSHAQGKNPALGQPAESL